MKELVKFERLKHHLEEIGIYVNEESGYKIIREDFNLAYKEGRITFEEEGIFIKDKNGKLYQGYMFQPEYCVSSYSYPRAHIYKCGTINDFLNRGTFEDFYTFSTAEINDVTDRYSRRIYEDVVLPVCKRCIEIARRKNVNGMDTSSAFYEILCNENGYKEDVSEIDLFGYTKKWSKISRLYREMKEWKCERCGIQLSGLDSRFLETHHKDYDKTNNNRNNLECLCIECHSTVDLHHESRYESASNKRRLDQFLKMKMKRMFGR